MIHAFTMNRFHQSTTQDAFRSNCSFFRCVHLILGSVGCRGLPRVSEGRGWPLSTALPALRCSALLGAGAATRTDWSGSARGGGGALGRAAGPGRGLVADARPGGTDAAQDGAPLRAPRRPGTRVEMPDGADGTSAPRLSMTAARTQRYLSRPHARRCRRRCHCPQGARRCPRKCKGIYYTSRRAAGAAAAAGRRMAGAGATICRRSGPWAGASRSWAARRAPTRRFGDSYETRGGTAQLTHAQPNTTHTARPDTHKDGQTAWARVPVPPGPGPSITRPSP